VFGQRDGVRFDLSTRSSFEASSLHPVITKITRSLASVQANELDMYDAKLLISNGRKVL
jgi:hypothetical protein